MFRKLLLSTTLVAACGSAFAADLPRRTAPSILAPAQAFSWNGFYAGLNVGVARNDNCKSSTLSSFDITAAPRVYTPIAGFGGGCNNSSNNGLIGGAQLGYNVQYGQLVFGVETDFDFTSRSRSASNYIFGTPAQIAGGGGTTVPFGVYAFPGDGGTNYVGTVRGRLGYAIDRTLLYVTGGLAYGNRSGNGSIAYYNAGTIAGAPTAIYSRPGSQGSGVGFALGAGVEQALTNTWSVKLEYLHTDLGRRSGGFSSNFQPAFTTTNYTVTTASSRNTNDSVRVGVNYRFY